MNGEVRKSTSKDRTPNDSPVRGKPFFRELIRDQHILEEKPIVEVGKVTLINPQTDKAYLDKEGRPIVVTSITELNRLLSDRIITGRMVEENIEAIVNNLQ